MQTPFHTHHKQKERLTRFEINLACQKKRENEKMPSHGKPKKPRKQYKTKQKKQQQHQKQQSN